MQSAPAFLFFVATGRHKGILQHGSQRLLVINAFDAFHKGICQDHLGIGSSLCSSVGIATAGIGQITVALIDNQQGVVQVSHLRLTQ